MLITLPSPTRKSVAHLSLSRELVVREIKLHESNEFNSQSFLNFWNKGIFHTKTHSYVVNNFELILSNRVSLLFFIICNTSQMSYGFKLSQINSLFLYCSAQCFISAR
jgi:hypothetical protein